MDGIKHDCYKDIYIYISNICMNLTYTFLLIVKWYFVLLYFVLVLFSNVYRNWGGFHDSGYLLTLMEVSSTRIVNVMNNISCTFLWSNKYISLSLSLSGVKKSLNFHLSRGQVNSNFYLSCCQITCPECIAK